MSDKIEQKGDKTDQISAIAETLEKLYFSCRAATHNAIESAFREALDTQDKVLAFQLSDGRSIEEVLTKVKMSSKTLPKLWKEWHGKGFGKRVSVQGGKRFVRMFSLEDFGFEIPKELESE